MSPTLIMIVVTSLAMMIPAAVVNCYDDHSGFCAGPEYICRYSQNMLPAGRTDQVYLYFKFSAHAFDSATVCRGVDGFSKQDPKLKVYAYFSCNLDLCFNCYRHAFTRLMDTDGCSGKDGGFITVDRCCLRYETYNFCGATN